MQGFDYEVGSKLANAPWLGVYAGGFYYDNKYSNDEKGHRLRSTMQFTPRFSMEMGYTKSNLTSGNLYGKVLYQLADNFGPSLSGSSQRQSKQSSDISYKLLQKVQRDNDIKTETFTKFVSYTGGISVSAINSNNSQPIQGVQVQAYQNGSAVGATALTDANGIAIISGLNVGVYTVRASYFSYTSDSAAVTVQTDQMANAVVPLSILSGNILVNVFDANAQVVSGATVIAHVANSGYAKAEGTMFDRIFGVKTVFAAIAEFTLRGTTDSQGKAHFNNLPPGNYSFTVVANTQTMQSISANIPITGGNAAVDVALPSSGIQDNNGSAAITVNNGSTVLVDATVSVTVAGTVRTATTNASGIAIFSDLPVGGYTFTASSINYTNNTGNVTIASGVTAAKTISLSLRTNTITASAGAGGSISPSGATAVNYNGSQTYTITPSAGYSIASVTVDGTVLGTTPSTYTFSNVTTTHTISVAFVLQTNAITASAGTGGSISPSGATAVNYNGSQTYSITPNAGYSIASVTVDGTVLGTTPSTYTFSNVTANHTIGVTFAQQQQQTFTITASVTGGPSIFMMPSLGPTTVNINDSLTYSMIPNLPVIVMDVLVDGVSQGIIYSYTFSNVTSNHTIVVVTD